MFSSIFSCAFWLSVCLLWRNADICLCQMFQLNCFLASKLYFVVQSQSCVWLLQTHGLQHSRLPCTSLSFRVCSNSCPLNQWCYLTISSSTALFSFCLQYIPASGSFLMSWLFASGGQSIIAQHQSFQWICCCSVAKLCLTLHGPMDFTTAGFPELHYFLEFAQIHVHWISDAI